MTEAIATGRIVEKRVTQAGVIVVWRALSFSVCFGDIQILNLGRYGVCRARERGGLIGHKFEV